MKQNLPIANHPEKLSKDDPLSQTPPQIIGAQPLVSELVGMAEKNRFNLLFQKFVGVFATAEHPLTIFLDDLQWADAASLKSIELLLSGTKYLLLLGAYRDNEVPQFHPLMLTLQQLQKTDAIINTITLAPLDFEDTNRLVADTLHCDLDTAKPLATAIDLKTTGNPFFTTQFLKALHADGEITFNPEGYWECDLVRVQSLSITDDVVKFMAVQLEKLPIKTQQIIKLAACIGDRFDLDTLKTVSEQSHLHTATALWQGLQAGLILPTSQIYKFFQPQHSQEIERDDSSQSPNADNSIEAAKLQVSIGELSVESKLNTPFSSNPNSTYRFLHDRVQQAAYSLIPQQQKRQIHLQIARLLSASTPNLYQSDRLLEIVNHYNLAMDLQPDMKIDLIDELAECQHLAKLNLLAAQKAKASTAYAAAFNYARIGAKILGTIGWQTAYQLTLSLHEILAEAAFLNGDLETVSLWTQAVLDRAQTPLDRVKTYETIIQFHILQKQYQQAIDRGLEILSQLGIKLPPQPHKLVIVSELAKTRINVWGKSNEKLLALPESTDPAKIAPLRILDLLIMPAFFAEQELITILVTTGIAITLEHGNTPWAASFYGSYAIILSELEDFKKSYQIGELALSLSDRFNIPAISAKVKATMPWFSQLWQRDFRANIAVVDDSISEAMDSGNLTFLGIGAYLSLLMRLYADTSLAEIAEKIPNIERVILYSKDESSQQLLSVYSKVIANLQFTSIAPYQLLASDLDESVLLSQWKADGQATALSTLYTAKMFLAYLFEDIEAALSAANSLLAYKCTGIVKASILDPLTRLAAYPHSHKSLQKQLLEQVNIVQSQLAKRAKLMPGNFQHKYDLVSAEKCRVLGDFTTAMELYDRAIMGARKYKYLHEEAISNECAAKFYRAWGKENIAATYMQSAYYCYTRWGAKAKTDDLERRYPELLRC